MAMTASQDSLWKQVSLDEVDSESRFGGKAWGLARAARARLPVPPGLAISVDAVDHMIAGRTEAMSWAAAALERLGGPVAVRSSAVGEDSASASFAGQHATVLNVQTPAALLEAIAGVRRSAASAGALAYRNRMGITGPARIAVVVQRLVDSECAGVLFCRHPVTGADERVIEAAWGLGESVVGGLVIPDRYRVARGGGVIERVRGDRDIAVRPDARGGTSEVELAPHEVKALCLDDDRLAALDELAAACEALFGGPQDIEFAVAAGQLYLLQSRAQTATR